MRLPWPFLLLFLLQSVVGEKSNYAGCWINKNGGGVKAKLLRPSLNNYDNKFILSQFSYTPLEIGGRCEYKFKFPKTCGTASEADEIEFTSSFSEKTGNDEEKFNCAWEGEDVIVCDTYGSNSYRAALPGDIKSIVNYFGFFTIPGSSASPRRNEQSTCALLLLGDIRSKFGRDSGCIERNYGRTEARLSKNVMSKDGRLEGCGPLEGEFMKACQKLPKHLKQTECKIRPQYPVPWVEKPRRKSEKSLRKGCYFLESGGPVIKGYGLSQLINEVDVTGRTDGKLFSEARDDEWCYYEFKFPENCRTAEDAAKIEFTGGMTEKVAGMDHKYMCQWNSKDVILCVMEPQEWRQLSHLVRYIGSFEIAEDFYKGGPKSIEQSSCSLLLLNEVKDKIENHPGCIEEGSDKLSLYVTGKDGRVEGCPPLEKAFLDSCNHLDKQLLGTFECKVSPQYDPINKVDKPWTKPKKIGKNVGKGCWTTEAGQVTTGQGLRDLINWDDSLADSSAFVEASDKEWCLYQFKYPKTCRTATNAGEIEFQGTVGKKEGNEQYAYSCHWAEKDVVQCYVAPSKDRGHLAHIVRYIGSFEINDYYNKEGGAKAIEQSSCSILLLDEVKDEIQNHPGCTEGDSDKLSVYVTGKNGRVEGCPPLEKAFMDSCGHIEKAVIENMECKIKPQYDPVNKVDHPWAKPRKTGKDVGKGCWTTEAGQVMKGQGLRDLINEDDSLADSSAFVEASEDEWCYYQFTYPEKCRTAKKADKIEFSAEVMKKQDDMKYEYECRWAEENVIDCAVAPMSDWRHLANIVRYIGSFEIDQSLYNGGPKAYEQSSCSLLLLDYIRNNIQNHPGCTEGDSDKLSVYVTGKNGRVEGCPPLEKAFQDSCGHVDSKLVGNIDCDILPQYDPVKKVNVPYGESEIVDVDPTDPPEVEDPGSEVEEPTDPPEIEEEVITAKPRDEDIKDPEEVFTAEPREEEPPPNVAVFTAKPETEDPTDEEEEEPEIVDPTEAPVEQEDPEEPTEAPDDDEGKDEPIGRPPATLKPGNDGDGSNSLNSQNTGSGTEDGKSSSEEDFPTWAIVVIAVVGVVLIAVPIIAFVVYKKKSQKDEKKKKKGKKGDTERTGMEASVITITAKKSKKSKKAKETKSKSKTKSRSRSTTASTAGTTARTPVSTTPGTTGTTTTDLNSKSTAPGSTINLA